MPIEFACPHCGRRLRTPDDSAGKRARCPSCQQVAQVPTDSAPPADGDDDYGDRRSPAPGEGLAAGVARSSSSADAANNPLPPVYTAGSSDGSAGRGADFNPYAAPQTDTYEVADRGSRFIITPRRRLDFNELLSVTWQLLLKFPLQILGFSLLFLVFTLLINVVGGMFAQILVRLVGIVDRDVAGLLGGLFSGALSLVLGSATTVLNVNFGLNLASGRPAFENLGRNIGRIGTLIAVMFAMFLPMGIVLGITVAAGAAGGLGAIIILVGALLGIFAMFYAILNFVLAPYFVVDQNLGVVDALRQSSATMTGNRLLFLGIMLATGILTVLGIVVTLGLGYLLVPGLMSVFYALIYAQLVGYRSTNPS